MGRHASWSSSPGEIAPGRTVLKRLGGGNRYEVHLVWDDDLFSIMVAKMLRPDQLGGRAAARHGARGRGAREPGAPGPAAGLRGQRRGVPASARGAPGGADAGRADPPGGPAAAPAVATADPAHRGSSALHVDPGLGAPRREAGQHRDGHPPETDRPQPGAHAGRRAGGRAAASAPASTCRRSSASPTSSEESPRLPTSGESGSPRTRRFGPAAVSSRQRRRRSCRALSAGGARSQAAARVRPRRHARADSGGPAPRSRRAPDGGGAGERAGAACP